MSITKLRKRDRTRDLLIRTAMQAFGEQGVADASVQQIAARAGVANGTFYVHFRTKEEILAAVAERLCGLSRCSTMIAPLTAPASAWRSTPCAVAFSRQSPLSCVHRIGR